VGLLGRSSQPVLPSEDGGGVHGQISISAEICGCSEQASIRGRLRAPPLGGHPEHDHPVRSLIDIVSYSVKIVHLYKIFFSIAGYTRQTLSVQLAHGLYTV